jgi:hypothetical protein
VQLIVVLASVNLRIGIASASWESPLEAASRAGVCTQREGCGDHPCVVCGVDTGPNSHTEGQGSVGTSHWAGGTA